jgi:tetratricopeptide (TPR) repeat protein
MSLWTLARWVLAALFVLLALGLVLLAWSAGWDVRAAVDKGVQLWADYSRVIDRIYDFVDRAARFIVPIATIGGAIYGVYHKWQYGKGRMHIHIREFLKRDDKRLMPTGKKLSTVVDRPGPDREFGPPIFSSKQLEPTLKGMRWGKLDAADKALTAELGKLKQQLEQWGNLEANYNRHRAQAHLVKGAIAAARAASRNGKDDDRKDDVEAFEQFKAAFELNKTDVEALEYMAHQRVRLGDHGNALSDFESLQKLAENEKNQLLVSRALKFQATIRETEGATRLLQNPNTRTDQEQNLQKARDLLTAALDALPDGERGGMEEAELYELRGRVNRRRQTFRLATDDYTAAERLYHRIANQTNDPDIRSDANGGSGRVKKALEEIRLRPLPSPDAPPSANGADGEALHAEASPVQPPNTDRTTKPIA